MANQRSDYYAQILRAKGNPETLDKLLQEQCRRRAAKKLAATLASAPGFRFPTELSAEQASADEVAEFHAGLIPIGSRVVDLTCGLGIDSFHIAKRAKHITAIDLHPKVAATVEVNAKALGLENIIGLNADCREWLKRQPAIFDIAFIDPGRRADDGSRLYSLKQCLPNVVEMLPEIGRVAKRLLIKASPMLDISHCLQELSGVSDVYAVGTRNECKELLFDITFGYEGPASIHAATVDAQSLVEITTKEPDCINELQVGDFIGEPWPAVMKTQPRGLTARQLHSATLLFKNPDDGFPGNIYRVERIEPFTSSILKRLAKEGIKASVATRNFPLTADELKRRLKSKENAETRLIGTTIHPNQPVLIWVGRLLK